MLKVTTTYPRATAVLERYKRYVVQQARSNLTKGGHKASGALYKSIRGYVDKKMNRSVKGKFTGGSTLPQIRFEMEDYGRFIDKGVKGSRSSYTESRMSPYKFGRTTDKVSVPVGSIRAWCRKKGIDQKLAFAIGRSVYQKGIRRTLFFSKPFEKRLEPMKRQYHSAVADDIARNFANQITKKLKQGKGITEILK